MENRYVGWEKMRPIEAVNICSIEHHFVNEEFNHIDALISEVESGVQRKDVLLDASYKLEGEAQAIYFSNMRRNMQTRVAFNILHGGLNTKISDEFQLTIILHSGMIISNTL